MRVEKLLGKLLGRVGEIYTARKGTATLILCEGVTYLIPNLSRGQVVVEPSPEYWVNSIDCSGSYIDYFAFRMLPPEKMTYPAKPSNEITQTQRERLKNMINYINSRG